MIEHATMTYGGLERAYFVRAYEEASPRVFGVTETPIIPQEKLGMSYVIAPRTLGAHEVYSEVGTELRISAGEPIDDEYVTTHLVPILVDEPLYSERRTDLAELGAAQLQAYKKELRRERRSAEEAKQQAAEASEATRYSEESMALATRTAWEILCALDDGPRPEREVLKDLCNSVEAFEAIARLHFTRMIRFRDGDLSIMPLGRNTLREFGIID